MRFWLPIVLVWCVGSCAGAWVQAGTPGQLLRGEAPVLFSGAEGEEDDTTLLLDGQSIRGDEIWLWVPAVVSGEVDLALPGQFFRVWDSGPTAGPDGNDDDANGMRALDFDQATSTFLISYEDSTTTGFSFGSILDGDLMELTVTNVTDGFITGFTWNRLFDECPNGSPGCIGTGDINAVHRASDGSLYFGSGAAQTLETNGVGTVSTTSSSLIHAELNPDPRNIGPSVFFEPSIANCVIIFCPGIYTGQLRGVDLLATGEVTFGTSGDYRNQSASGNDVEVIGIKSDILALPEYFTGATLLDQRTAEVLYPGSLFFETPGVGDAEILGHDVLDSSEEINALIAVLGASSPAGVALTPFGSATPIDLFIRGDVNNDGGFDIGDPIFLLANLFQFGPEPACEDAADINDDGGKDIADAVYGLNALFVGGNPGPPAPSPPDCGADPTPDALSCEAFDACP